MSRLTLPLAQVTITLRDADAGIEGEMMNRNIFAILDPANPLMTQALDAMKRYYEAQQAKLADEDVERMRLEAEVLFRTVNEFQQRMLGRRFDTLH